MANPVIPVGFGNVHVFETLNVDGDVTINGALNATVPPQPPQPTPVNGVWDESTTHGAHGPQKVYYELNGTNVKLYQTGTFAAQALNLINFYADDGAGHLVVPLLQTAPNLRPFAPFNFPIFIGIASAPLTLCRLTLDSGGTVTIRNVDSSPFSTTIPALLTIPPWFVEFSTLS